MAASRAGGLARQYRYIDIRNPNTRRAYMEAIKSLEIMRMVKRRHCIICGCKKIFSDKLSGSRAERAGLTQAQEAPREGDTLVVWKLDRLGRSVKNLVNLEHFHS